MYYDSRNRAPKKSLSAGGQSARASARSRSTSLPILIRRCSYGATLADTGLPLASPAFWSPSSVPREFSRRVLMHFRTLSLTSPGKGASQESHSQNRVHVFSTSCALFISLFCIPKMGNCTVFYFLRTLGQKHPGWGVAKPTPQGHRARGPR